MPTLAEMLPPLEALLALEPEELAAVILVHLNSRLQDPYAPRSPGVHPGNFTNPDDREGFGSFPREAHEKLGQAMMEAWAWLAREGLIVRRPGPEDGGWMTISRRGRRIRSADDFRKFKAASALPAGLLHPEIEERARGNFLRGDYETAVFQAFRAIEIRIREVCGFTADTTGVQIVRDAFVKNTGPLADTTAPQGEQEGLSPLFAGAIQCMRNSTAHRSVSIDATEAVQLLAFASCLLRIVDSRAAAMPTAP